MPPPPPIRPLPLFLLIVLGLGLIFCFALPKLTGPGRLEIAEREIVWRSPPLQGGITSLRANMRVPLLNSGGETVRITGVESGCGCTSPSVLPMVIEPGKDAILTLVGSPLSSGEKTVLVTIHTDSKLTPVVTLNFKMISDRKAPFVQQIYGDLAYTDDAALTEPREVVVATVEPKVAGKFPKIQSDLDFLKISEPIVEESPFDEGGLVARLYKYQVSIKGRPEGSFTGRVWLEDLWGKFEAHELLVARVVKPRLTAVPSIINLQVGPEGTGKSEFRVLVKENATSLRVDCAESSEAKLTVIELDGTASSRLRSFAVTATLAKGAKGLVTTSIVAKTSREDSEGLIIPVLIKRNIP